MYNEGAASTSRLRQQTLLCDFSVKTTSNHYSFKAERHTLLAVSRRGNLIFIPFLETTSQRSAKTFMGASHTPNAHMDIATTHMALRSLHHQCARVVTTI